MPRDIMSAFSIDLADGYFHFKLHPKMRKFFTFSFLGKYYECIAIPFGFNYAPLIFTYCMKPVVAAIRNA